MTETKNTYSNLKFCELTLQNQESAKEDKVSRMMVIFS